ncbi:hypothetical protein B0H14DRAFT_3474123 [Mycena olivaceomarginata]|nr:hypothetical protein B0H14DRAFT_3474123 [Mycena olivaceomarginata]
MRFSAGILAFFAAAVGSASAATTLNINKRCALSGNVSLPWLLKAYLALLRSLRRESILSPTSLVSWMLERCQQRPLGQLDHVHTRHNSSHS